MASRVKSVRVSQGSGEMSSRSGSWKYTNLCRNYQSESGLCYEIKAVCRHNGDNEACATYEQIEKQRQFPGGVVKVRAAPVEIAITRKGGLVAAAEKVIARSMEESPRRMPVFGTNVKLKNGERKSFQQRYGALGYEDLGLL